MKAVQAQSQRNFQLEQPAAHASFFSLSVASSIAKPQLSALTLAFEASEQNEDTGAHECRSGHVA